MKKNLLLILLCMGFLFVSCSPAVVQKNNEPEPVVEQPKWQEISAETVSFVRMHPGAAQKNTYASWKHFEKEGAKEWRIQQKVVSDEGLAALEKLYVAVESELIPSDALYGCRYRENMPEYRLNFQHGGHVYALVSASNCLHGAPWNVQIDGKSYVQVNGAIGIALEELLHSADVALNVGDSAGMITLSEPIELDGYTANGNEKPVAWFDAEFRKDATFGAWIQGIEGLFGPSEMPEIACNQANSEDCHNVSARYIKKFGHLSLDKEEIVKPEYEFPVVLKYSAGTVSTKVPPVSAFEALKRALSMPELAFWPKAAEHADALRVSWSAPEECKMVRGLAKHFDKPETASCGTWTITSKGFPTAIYYVGLDAIWLEPGHDYKLFFDSLSKYRKNSKKLEKFNYKSFTTPDKDTNLFLRSNGKPIAFVTKKGKTSIVE